MPTFETNVPVSAPVVEKTEEFRPRHRSEWQGNLDETFDPAPIPPEVKQSIDKRVSDIMRQCSGPDETFFAAREWWSTARKVVANLPAILKDMLLHRDDSASVADEEELEEEAEAEEESETNSSDSKPVPDAVQDNRPAQQHRGRRGGRRHSHRGGGGGGRDQGGGRQGGGSERRDDY
jgi:hypothetical protein